jgi:hypothetical protein
VSSGSVTITDISGTEEACDDKREHLPADRLSARFVPVLAAWSETLSVFYFQETWNLDRHQ